MVERPIKKSDRQPKAETENNAEDADSLPAAQPSPKISNPIISNPKISNPKILNPIISKQSDDRPGGKGKKYPKESISQVNPAFARGPKPAKSQPPVIIESQDESQPTSEEPQD